MITRRKAAARQATSSARQPRRSAATAPRRGKPVPRKAKVSARPAFPAGAEEDLPSLLGPFRSVTIRPGGAQRPGEEAIRALQSAAMQWSHIARNRRRWAGSPQLAADQGARAMQFLLDSGFGDRALSEMARARIVQVSVPFVVEERGWESRILPWEFILSSATRDLRGGGTPLTVLRQLKREGSPLAPVSNAPEKVLYVECRPGKLKGLYEFASERTLVNANLRAGPQRGEVTPERDGQMLENPSPAELEKAVRDYRPDIVHLAGFDTRQGYQLLGWENRGGRESLLDGVLLRDDQSRSGVVAVDAEEIARILTLGDRKKPGLGAHRPQLVCCSFWNSAARIAPMLVARGARAAIGFQDTFDDALGEFFFASFYRRYRASGWDLRDAFVSAWELLRQQPVGLEGTGLVLWSEAPLTGAAEAAAEITARRKQLTEALALEATLVDPSGVSAPDVRKYVAVEVAAFSEMNYSLLHNRQPLFKVFKLLSVSSRRPIDIDVTVELSAGEFSALCRRTLNLEEGEADLRALPVPLTAPLLRGVRESVFSILFVEVKWGPHTLYRDTMRVQLLPADQWRFDDSSRSFVWLPSFVFPRDRAVGTLMEKAQRYVRVLRDDPAAGFEGYQAIDDERDDRTEDIDLQVQAIWSAIVHEWQLVYTNPPPTYSRGIDSQRLRTPSTILRDRFGTCIDTSLLLCSCLELIDVYPVIFLLNDHAFPGYWRSDDAHASFNKMTTDWVDEMTQADLREAAGDGAAQGWVLTKSGYDEILRQIDEGNLVPIESTMLTEGAGFWAAVEAARENFVPKKNFHSMLDIANARMLGVTPLPIREE